MAEGGIYEIVNLLSGNRYIGSAKSFAVRWARHLFELRRGTHHSRYLQAAWGKYGEGAFAFRPMIICAEADLITFEQAVIDAYRPTYNVSLVAGYRTFQGRRHSPETLAKMSEAHKGNTRTKGKPRKREAVERTAAGHRGKKRSAETRARISAAMTGKSRSFSAETRAKLSAAMKARPPNPERVAKMAATKRGSTLSAEHRAKIGAASKVMWERRKAARS